MKTLALFLGTLTLAGAACAAGPAASAPAASAAPAAPAAAPQTLASGMTIQHLIKGTGASPKATDTVQVHYRGTLADGTEFDSSYKRGQPISFPLNRVIPCWTEGVQAMQVGGKARLTCPPGTAYGARGVPGTIPPNATLTFEVVLLGVGG
ncbi:Peptidyl-prolyl cis-trans isomerase [Cupriavidus taiwanensis]|uniref:Peptidyl-prolyl cis-trans isomerase n=1 Tax=Cupriavidus taiwanensis TaxID=164546 RepID=A0A976B269_9BURK|nr:FKBP-type peptidyl-prolyl cis-trans isomerase [Cupriavidus taiwanensis]SOZ18436.1 Peptidyl-prolyl cis-trans isomerase [Cupriavidus taiwanensis]SOZ31507.1 Peptidyl-prolyl cis-trans isomerase [Cupriavidus taiwanensis]SOZ47468.1 Peptidyl-prolyl cis-trans isomerase [Cupriavidus taiwanensis]SOZ67402.1 Peptidyl-prolyl cis-trans isomerase [Cupriavidus taiwanensis]SOZ68624.1 Peptidyl-prolyl cis-trans isomerase [Cupriavidus taiwanensis]